jgi:hypothetical protein
VQNLLTRRLADVDGRLQQLQRISTHVLHPLSASSAGELFRPAFKTPFMHGFDTACLAGYFDYPKLKF